MKVRIKKILEEKGRSIYWLAIQCNVTYKSMFNLVNNKTSSVICNVLEVTPNDIFDFEN